MDVERISLRRALLAGVLAGSIAAVAAALLSLATHSPDALIFNSVSVGIGALLVGLGGGAVWWAVQQRPAPWRTLALAVLVAFILVALAALIEDALPSAPLSGVSRYVIPLAALSFGLVAILTPLLARPLVPTSWLAPAGLLVACAVAVALAGQTQTTSGKLALPALAKPAQTVSARATRAATSEATAATSAVTGQASATAAIPTAGVLTPKDVAGVAFTVMPGKSQATYTVREKLARLPSPDDAVGKTSTITGTVHLDGRPSTITVDLRTLQSNQPLRDSYIRDRGAFKTSQHPYAVFTLTNLGDLPATYQQGQTVTRNVTGTMTINDVQKPMTFAVDARMQGNELDIHGTTDFTWNDFQIPPPNLGGFVTVENTVHVEVLLEAVSS
jgi:polyisoprenoid-binding protein YceI